ncbi:MAG: hypothetical protein AAF226_12410 [Verrucomicrobiota bacterium]
MTTSSINKSEALAQLRQQLKGQFAEAHRDYSEKEPCESGIDWLDDGGLFKGGIFEIVSGPSSSSAGLIGELLQYTLRHRERLVLIDAMDAFDPSTLPLFEQTEQLSGQTHSLAASFLWLRCRSVEESVKIADLILRDGNLPRVVLDLELANAADLRSIPSSSWYRLRSLTEEAGSTCLSLTSRPTLPCAAIRYQLQGEARIDRLDGGYRADRTAGRVMEEKSNIISLAA